MYSAYTQSYSVGSPYKGPPPWGNVHSYSLVYTTVPKQAPLLCRVQPCYFWSAPTSSQLISSGFNTLDPATASFAPCAFSDNMVSIWSNCCFIEIVVQYYQDWDRTVFIKGKQTWEIGHRQDNGCAQQFQKIVPLMPEYS